jgi:hypothetical protein
VTVQHDLTALRIRAYNAFVTESLLHPTSDTTQLLTDIVKALNKTIEHLDEIESDLRYYRDVARYVNHQ